MHRDGGLVPLLPTYAGTSSADDGECESNKTAEVNHAPFVAARLVYAMKETHQSKALL